MATSATERTSHLLIADDDRAIRNALELLLTQAGYHVTVADDGAAVLEIRKTETFDALLLDVMMPLLDGLTVCKVIRAEGDPTPILMLTARTETEDRVAGLDAGADDYLPKPFDPPELLARVRALLRRGSLSGALSNASNNSGHSSLTPHGVPTSTSPQDQSVVGDQTREETPLLHVEDLRLDPAARRAWRGEREILLSKTEFDLLELLMYNQGIVLERITIYDRIWGYDFGPDSKNLAVYISYLRRKVDEGASVPLIHTVRGVGYTVRAQ